MKDQTNRGTGNQSQNPQHKPQTGTEKQETPRQGGGHAGYSSEDEQKQVNKENEQMHNERNEKDLDTSREQKIDIDEDDRSKSNEKKHGKGL